MLLRDFLLILGRRMFQYAKISLFCHGIGAAASLKVPGFNLYLGTDSIITAFTPEMVPVNKLHTRLTAGLAIAF